MPDPTKHARRRKRVIEAKKMVAIFNRIGTDNPPSAHEVVKMEARRASNPSQMERFMRETNSPWHLRTRPLHDILFKTISRAPIFDWMNVGVDVPTGFFEGLIAEGMKEPYPERRPRNGQILFSRCPIWIIDMGHTGALVVHCQNLDIHTHQFTAHQQLTLARSAMNATP